MKNQRCQCDKLTQPNTLKMVKKRNPYKITRIFYFDVIPGLSSTRILTFC